jgi:SAM-dependent methyltransferase
MSRNQDTTERERAGQIALEFFDGLWRQGDYWDLERSSFERSKYERQIALLQGRRYPRVLEIGCGAGAFTRRLAPLADYILALDVAPAAVTQARAAGAEGGCAEFLVENVMDRDFRADHPWDLIVMSETVYYLGWLYSFFDVTWLANELLGATAPGGKLVMANTRGGASDCLLLPWVIQTYHDLFLNVGYVVETEEVFRGQKNGVTVETLISVFAKPPASAHEVQV